MRDLSARQAVCPTRYAGGGGEGRWHGRDEGLTEPQLASQQLDPLYFGSRGPRPWQGATAVSAPLYSLTTAENQN